MLRLEIRICLDLLAAAVAVTVEVLLVEAAVEQQQ